MWPFDRRIERVETRQTLKELERLILGDNPDSIIVTPANALTCTTVHACTRILSESISQLPWHLYRRVGNGRERASEHPLAAVLNKKAAPFQTAVMFREQTMIDVCTHGNSYAVIVRNRSKQVIEVHRLEPTAVSVKRYETTLEPIYEVSQKGGPVKRYPFRDILHFRWLSTDGLNGSSPVELAKDEIRLALGLQSYASRIFRDGKKDAVVSRVMDTMRDWRFSPFEHEGSARAGIRSALCLEGNSWQLSDNEAMALITEALKRMGAKRPTVLQGQREYTISVENCQRCGGLLDEDDKARHRRFCSEECRDWCYLNSFLLYRVVSGLARGAAWYAAKKEKLPERPCEWCGRPFRPNTLEYYRKTQTCSDKCTRALVAVRYETKRCAHCDKWYKPTTYNGKFCTVACRDQHRSDERCAASAKGRQPRPCEECGRTFTPTKSDQQFCGVRCGWKSHNEKVRMRRREKIAGKICQQCDEPFDALKSNARFCSTRCHSRYRYLRKVDEKLASAFTCEEVKRAA